MTKCSSEGNSQAKMSYAKAGVNIDTADATKKVMAKSVNSSNPRVLNKLGAFASLYDINFSEYSEPVLVTKMEEPGSKQLLAAQHGKLASVGFDLINHLINDLIMAGARPLAIQDTIICGKLEKDVVLELVDAMARACCEQGCDLVGGETSEQPRVIPEGSYILSAAAVGIVDKSKIIDGSRIAAGDAVLGVASNGVHTNGYTLIRSLLDANPELAEETVDGERFIDYVLRPHLCYNLALQRLFGEVEIKGLAHVTGGGIVDNLKRILPKNVSAAINLDQIEELPIFSKICQEGSVDQADMLRTFNLGVGLIVVVEPKIADLVKDLFEGEGQHAYQIGEIVSGTGEVSCRGNLRLCRRPSQV
jgi:phosphoribosylformylglycinamidine cyclo-ligase